MLMSMTWAPFSTCWRATATASSNCSSRIRRAKAFEPVTLARSPTLTKRLSSPIFTGSSPESFIRWSWRRHDARRQSVDRLRDRADVVRRRAAAAAGDVDEARLRKLLQQARRDVRRLVEPGFAHRVRQSRIRIDADETIRDVRQFLDVGPHQRGAQRAVQADRERPCVAHRVPECLDRLAAQDAARGVGHGAGDHHRHARLTQRGAAFELGFDREDRGLGVQRVEDRFDQQQVGAAIEQSARLFAVGQRQLVERDIARAGIVDVGRNRCGLRCRAQRPGHEAGPVRRHRSALPPLSRCAPPRRSFHRRGVPAGSRPAQSRSRRRCWSRSGPRRQRGTARGFRG